MFWRMFNLKNRTLKKMLLLLSLSLLILAGCGPEGNISNSREGEQSFLATLTDDLGREVVIEHKPERIVSLAPSKTEMLFALGLGEYMVGVSEYCDYPDAALDKPKAGSFSQPNIEQIVALDPHLIVAVPLQEEELARLMELDLPVLVLSPDTVEEIYHSLRQLGEATGVVEEAHLLVEQMQTRIGEVSDRVAELSQGERKRVYYEVYADPLMSVGSTSVIHELIEQAGGDNIFADVDTAYPKISAEAVVDRDPDVIIFPNFHGTEGFLADEIYSRPGWDATTAVKQERVVGIDPDIISRSGPRVVEAIEQLAVLIYPDIRE